VQEKRERQREREGEIDEWRKGGIRSTMAVLIS
jgi:hypothetical protein